MVRFKNRYITLKIVHGHSNDALTVNTLDVYKEVLHAVQYLHGDFGYATVKFGFSVKYYNDKTRIVILRARHGSHKYVTSSLPFVNKLKDVKVGLRILYIGATLRHCYKVIIKHQKAELLKISTLNSEEEKSEFMKKVINVESTL